MRILYPILFFCLLLSCNVKPRRPITPAHIPESSDSVILKTTSSTEIPQFAAANNEMLRELFNCDSIEANGTGWWIPDVEDLVNIGPFHNITLATVIDTTYTLQLYGKEHLFVVFVSTIYSNGEKCDGHVCAPWIGIGEFKKTEDNLWTLYAFEKLMCAHGSWGDLQPYELTAYGENHYCLSLNGSFMAQGQLLEMTRLIDLTHEFGKEILRINTLNTNSGAIEEQDAGYYLEQADLKWIIKNGFYDLLVQHQSTRRNDKLELIQDHWEEHYRYSTSRGLFLPDENHSTKELVD